LVGAPVGLAVAVINKTEAVEAVEVRSVPVDPGAMEEQQQSLP
jgi:hypothetical protein